jgi:hypothetical protein
MWVLKLLIDNYQELNASRSQFIFLKTQLYMQVKCR